MLRRLNVKHIGARRLSRHSKKLEENVIFMEMAKDVVATNKKINNVTMLCNIALGFNALAWATSILRLYLSQ